MLNTEKRGLQFLPTGFTSEGYAAIRLFHTRSVKICLLSRTEYPTLKLSSAEFRRFVCDAIRTCRYRFCKQNNVFS